MKTTPFVAAAVLLAAVPSLRAAPLTYANAVEADSPFAYYRLGEASGTVAADSSASGFGGTYVGSPTLGAAGAGGGDTAATFNNSYMTSTGLDSLGTALGAFTVELVLKTTVTSHGYLLGSTNTGAATSLSLQLNTATSGTTSSSTPDALNFFVRADDGKGYMASFTSAALFDGSYHDLALSFSVAGGLAVYLDGTALSLSLNTSNNLTAADAFSAFTNAFAVGGDNVRGTITPAGGATIDEASFYTSALTASQIQDHVAALAVPEPEPSAIVGLFLAALALAVPLRRRLARA